MKKTIALLTDIHLDEESAIQNGAAPREQLLAVIDDIQLRDVHELVIAGDIGEPTSYKWFFEQVEKTNIHYHALLGNHDDYVEAVKHFSGQDDEALHELYYTFEDEYFLYLFLDSSSSTVSDAQLRWLRLKLKGYKKVLVFIHHPVLPVETEVDVLYPLFNRQSIKEILQSVANEVYIFSGHYHTADVAIDKNIRQHLTPAVSFQIVKQFGKIEIDNSSFGYSLIHLNNDEVTIEVILLKR